MSAVPPAGAVADPRAFLDANTELVAPPLLPEIRLHLASEITPLWEATEADLEQAGLPPPFWAFCWPGGQALARFLLDHRDRVAGKRVLDFACGCGVAGIAAALAGARDVLVNDVDPLALAAAEINAEANGARITAAPGDLVGSAGAGCEVLLAGDICYEKPLADRVTAWLRDRAAAGCAVLLADPGRTYLPAEGLIPLTTYTVPTTLELEDREVRETTVWQVAS